MPDVSLGAVVSGAIAVGSAVGSCVGWFVRELWAERTAERRAERDYTRGVRAARHERRVQIAEHALTRLNTSMNLLAGMLHAFRAELQGKVRPEFTAAVIGNAQERMNNLSEDTHQALTLMRFHFGDKVAGELDASANDAAEAQERLSEFMTFNDSIMSHVQEAAAEFANGTLTDETHAEVVRSFRDATQEQVKRLDRVIELVERGKGSVRIIESQLRDELWSGIE